MNHDRIHAREPSHDVDRWSIGTIESIDLRDGHCVFTVRPQEGDPVELTVTVAVRDLVLDRLETDGDPVGERVWFRKRGG
jgi:hypothetical protein